MTPGIEVLFERLRQARTVAPLERVENYVKTLSPGDRFITYTLGVLVFASCLVGFFALTNAIFVHVPAYGGTLAEGVVGSPRFVNPLLAISDADRDITTLTFAGLMGVARDGTLTPVLAKSFAISDDGRTYTFILRDNAEFSDGSPVTADDVVFTVTKAQDPALKSPQFADWSGVAVEATDPHTVTFTLSKPYAPFLQNTTLGILPAHIWRSIPDEQFPFSTYTISPVGAGPFKTDSIKRDATGLITKYALTANRRYVLGRPYLRGITFTYFGQEEDLVNALRAGNVESAYGVPEKKTLTAPYARVFGVFFNPGQNALFARSEVRKALSLAIDRENITKQALGGYATPIMGPVPPGSGIHNTPVPTASTTEAMSVLTAGGWSYDQDAHEWKNASAKLTFDSVTIKTSNVPELKTVATEVKKDWEKLGIAVDIELYEPGDLNQNVIRPRKYEALLFGMVIGRDADLYAFWDSAERNDPGLNIALYANKTVDSLLEDSRTAPDGATRLGDLQKVEDAVASDYPAAFTHAPDFIYAVPERLHGVVLPQITTPADRFANVSMWYVRTDAVWPVLAKSH